MSGLYFRSTGVLRSNSQWFAIALALVNLALFTGTALAQPGSVDLPLQEPRRHWAPPAVHDGSALSRAVAIGTLAEEEAAGRDRINLRRGQIGLATVGQNSQIETAARAHSTYLGLNNLSGHNETPGTTGFYDADPGLRVKKAGYDWRHVGEVVATGPFSGTLAVENLITAIYHRFGIFDTAVDDFGVGMYLAAAQGRFTANFATKLTPLPSAPANWIGVYPYPGQTGVTRDFFSREESPNPVPLNLNLNRVGYPVSLHVDSKRTLSVTSFTVAPVGGAALETAVMLSSTTDVTNNDTPPSVAAVIPKAVLEYGTTYQANFTGTLDGAPLTKSWQFKTVDFVPVTITGPATANIGDTITLSFSGGSGVFSSVAWPRYEAVVSAQKWLGTDGYQFKVDTAGTNQVRLTDSEGHEGTFLITVASTGLPVTFTGPATLKVGDPASWTLAGGTLRYTNVGWSNSAVLSFVSLVGNTVSFNATGVGDTTITVTDSAGVAGTTSVSVTAATVVTTTTSSTSSTTSTTTTTASTTTTTSATGSTTTTTAAPTTTTTTAITTSTTTVATTTTTTLAGAGGAFNLLTGWNLVGNGMGAAIDVATKFANTSQVNTVWKWIANGAKWAFYAPSLSSTALSDYAAGKGYDVLATINAGEGFWVNVKVPFALQLSGSSVLSTAFADGVSANGLPSGWSLIAIGDGKTPAQFVNAIPLSPPAAGKIATSITTLWAWDASQTNWYFYAPSLDNSGGLAAYVVSKSYLNFGAGTLSPTTGFWVNKP